MRSTPSYPTTVIATDLDYGEGPRWRDGRVWFSDMFRHCVRTVTAKGALETIAPLDRPSGLGFLPDGRLLAVSSRTATLHVLEDGAFAPAMDLGENGAYTLNDMWVLPSGTIYVDRYVKSERFDPVDSVVRVAFDKAAEPVATGFCKPNGIVASRDGTVLYLAETFGQKIWRFDIRPDGSLGGKVLHADLKDRRPDGIALDAEGGLWVGAFNTGEFLRLDSDGKISHIIPIPGRWAVAPVLGGDDGRTLFLFTAETELDGRFRQGIADGRIETARVDVPSAYI